MDLFLPLLACREGKELIPAGRLGEDWLSLEEMTATGSVATHVVVLGQTQITLPYSVRESTSSLGICVNTASHVLCSELLKAAESFC